MIVDRSLPSQFPQGGLPEVPPGACPKVGHPARRHCGGAGRTTSQVCDVLGWRLVVSGEQEEPSAIAVDYSNQGKRGRGSAPGVYRS